MSAEVVEDIPTVAEIIPTEGVEVMLERIEARVNEIHAFCTTLSAMLDAMGNNPMFAAMMPPGVFPE